MGILSKAGVGFRISPEFLISRGWKDPDGWSNLNQRRIYFDKYHFLVYCMNDEGRYEFHLIGRDIKITKIDQILLIEGIWTAKTQKRKEKLKRKLFGKCEKPKTGTVVL